MSDAATASRPIVPRQFQVDFSPVPRHWLADNPAATAIANGVNLLFPHGERFFVRSVNHFLDRIDDPTLRAQIKGFFGQEGRHSRAHDQFNAALRAQGYDIDAFLDRFARASSWLEARVSPEIRLAATAAAEHFTAILAAGAFTRGLLDRAAPEMRALLAWHAAEEIEHKSVAFDVLQAVAPAYHVRVIGLAYATAVLGVFWGYGALMLMRQDGLGPRAARRALGRLPRRERIVRDVFLRGIRQYLARDFHPRNVDDGELAAAWMAANGVTLPRPVHEAA